MKQNISTPALPLIGGLVLGSIAAAWVMQDTLQTLVMALQADGKAFWHLARASGLAAYAVLSLSMIFGLSIASRAAENAAAMLSLHRFSALLGLGLGLLHGALLLGDAYLQPSVAQLLIPFAVPHRLWLWIGLGQVAFYALLPIAVAFYLRRPLGSSAWRWLHYTVFTAYLMATLHGLFAGSDTLTLPALTVYVLCNSAVIGLVVYRIIEALSLR
ncbi:MAG: hypothetical protein Q4G42_05865 [Neisseria sp.]|nr:hypothetical protein [Neisseria sp.]